MTNASELVDSCLKACVSLQPGLSLDIPSRGTSRLSGTNRFFSPSKLGLTEAVVYRPPRKHEKVTLLSGGGSGHEPGHAGYVAPGMLDAAVSGPIFASPSAKHIRTGLRKIRSPGGTLVIVKNYTGDRLNFGLAVEESRAYDGSQIDMIVVEDDVAIPRSRSGPVGRRGLAGVVLVHKVAGASAEEGNTLEQVAADARFIASRLATIGVSLDSCDVPGAEKGRNVTDGELELGMGIHNEPGTQIIPNDYDPAKLVATMLKALLDKQDKDRGYLEWESNSQFVLLINNLGGLSKVETTALTHYALEGLSTHYGIHPYRIFSGTFLSSLDGPGFSLTLLALPVAASSETTRILKLLDAPTECQNWPPPQRTASAPSEVPNAEGHQEEASIDKRVTNSNDFGSVACECDSCSCRIELMCSLDDTKLLIDITKNIHASLQRAGPEITRFDTFLGDGDCGTTLLAGSSGLVAEFGDNARSDASGDLFASMQRVADTLSNTMGGTSGALYSIFFSALVGGLKEVSRQSDPDFQLDLRVFAQALNHALRTLRKYTAAGVGDRTMMDALIPFIDTLNQADASDPAVLLENAVDAARKGRDETRFLQSRFGRSTYVGSGQSGTANGDEAMPDPGACGVVAIVEGLHYALSAPQL